LQRGLQQMPLSTDAEAESCKTCSFTNILCAGFSKFIEEEEEK